MRCFACSLAFLLFEMNPKRRRTYPPKGNVLPSGVELTTSSLAMRDPAEVCSLSSGMMFQSLSDPLQTGVRLLRYPVPASPWARLAARFPVREGYGLTVLHPSNISGLDPAFPSVALSSARRHSAGRHPSHIPFGPSLSATLACF